MRQMLYKRVVLGLAVVIIGGLCAASLEAQPPGKKGKGPKGPPPNAEFLTVNGTVKEFTTAPKGEVDGLILNDGTWVHWPPHMESRFSGMAVKGDRIRVKGYMETGKKGETKLETSILTNLRTQKSAENPDRPPRADSAVEGTVGSSGAITKTGTVREFTTAPKGEVDGLMLADGIWVHWPPHLESRFTGIAKGDRIKVTGFMETGKKGETKLEVSSLTNERTGKTIDNPDRPLPSSARLLPGRAGNVEDRLQALEDQLEQMRLELQRLRSKK
jgi:hypothetical protein